MIWCVAVNGETEGGLGHEEIAGHKFEGIAGRVRMTLVVARDHGALTLIVDDDLCGPEDMAGGNERYGNVLHLERFAIWQRLRLAQFAEAQAHDGERVGGRQHRAMARSRVVRVAMRDHRARHGGRRVDEEIAGCAIEAGRPGLQPAFEGRGRRHDPHNVMRERSFRNGGPEMSAGSLTTSGSPRNTGAPGYAVHDPGSPWRWCRKGPARHEAIMGGSGFQTV